MWFLYVPLIALVLVAAGSALLGVGIIVAIPALVLAVLIAVVALVARAGRLRLTRVDAPGAQGLPGTRDASYEPRQDPGTTPTGSSTGTP